MVRNKQEILAILCSGSAHDIDRLCCDICKRPTADKDVILCLEALITDTRITNISLLRGRSGHLKWSAGYALAAERFALGATDAIVLTETFDPMSITETLKIRNAHSQIEFGSKPDKYLEIIYENKLIELRDVVLKPDMFASSMLGKIRVPEAKTAMLTTLRSGSAEETASLCWKIEDEPTGDKDIIDCLEVLITDNRVIIMPWAPDIYYG